MAFRTEQNPLTGEPEIVIDGWENGVADSPEFGIADLRNVNNDSQPGIALCNYKLVSQAQTPFNNAITSVDTVNDTVSFSGTPVIYGTAVVFTGGSLPGGITAGETYYAVNPFASGTTGNTIRLTDAYDPANGLGNIVDITSSGTGNVASKDMRKPMGYVIDNNRNGVDGNYYVQDSAGQVFVYAIAFPSTYQARWVLLKQTTTSSGSGSGTGTPTNANGNGIVFYNKYLFSFRNNVVDVYDAYGQEGTPYSWNVAWQTLLGANGTNTPHYAINATGNNVIYYTDTFYIGDISTASTTPKIADFAISKQVLQLPPSETANNLVEPSIDTDLGGYIYIGTSTSNYIYPWRRFFIGANGNTTYDAPLLMPEVGTYKFLNINRIVYILAGQRGNIYFTDGSSIKLFKSVPKYPTGNPYSTFTWGGIMSLNNNLCFGIQDNTPTGVAQNNASGCWAITLGISQYGLLQAGAIRYKGLPSAGRYNTNILIPQNDSLTYFAGWYAGTTGGIDILDVATPTFYSNYESYIESDIIPIGTALQQKTFNTIEAKLDTPLTTGEKFKISIRSYLNGTTYTDVFEQTTVGATSGDSSSVGLPIQLGQWVQVKASLQTSGTSNSFVRLREIRLR